MIRAKTLLLFFCALLAAGPVAAQKLYKYVDEQGRVRYTDRPPIDMAGRASDQLNRQGTVIKHNPAALTPEEVAAQEAERKRKTEADAAAREERRKNMALLATYPSMADLDDAHARALANNTDAKKQVETRIVELKKRQEKLQQEAEFYKNKPLPAQLKGSMFELESDLKAQSELLAAKNGEVDLINARFAEDKRRYLELTKGGSPGKTASSATTQTR
ncbi:MAG: DUF4124 domain-containing protein [Burkholderiales bacterium]|nr:DUF4124 domain-containing protein [Burkholderiales bacterium]